MTTAHSRIGMAPRMAPRPRRIKKATAGLASLRLHQLYGDSPATWDNRMYGATSDFRQVARINGVLRDLGQHEKVAELNAVIDASLAPRRTESLDDALHRAELADAAEQMADEAFRDKLRRGTATVEDARELLRKSARQRTAGEELERELLHWIEEKERGQ